MGEDDLIQPHTDTTRKTNPPLPTRTPQARGLRTYEVTYLLNTRHLTVLVEADEIKDNYGDVTFLLGGVQQFCVKGQHFHSYRNVSDIDMKDKTT